MLYLLRSRSPIPPAVTTSPTDTLSDALKSFQDCLDPDQKAKLQAIKAVPDAHTVAEFTHQLDQENAKRKSRCVAARLSPLLESIQQFSGVVETFVSSHPQVAALIWGSVKLVLQIASNFTTYFDKLSTLLMTIGKRCPRFQEYQRLYGSSTNLQKAFCDFYSVVVRCCEQAVLAIRRTGYIQLLKAMTGSFNSEFDSILTPMMMASQILSDQLPAVVANKAKDFMTKRSKSTPATSKLLLPRGVDHTSHAVTRTYQFLQYASEFWLSHTTVFSPEQDLLWNLFRSLAEERYAVLSEPHISTSLQDPDDRVTALRDYMFSHQHQALFRQWVARQWHAKDLPWTLALVLRWECFSFVRLLPPLAKHPGSSWLAGVLSLEDYDLENAMRSAGNGWMRRLTLTERSDLLVRIVGSYELKFLITATELAQLDIDPFYECNNQGRMTTPLEELIRAPDIVPLKGVCKAMLASNADFERTIAHPGRTALHVAADLGKSGATSVLLEHGALINATDDNGQTAMHLAARGTKSSTLNTVQRLLEAKASLDITDKYGKVALDYATGGVKGQISNYIRTGHLRATDSASDRLGGSLG